MKSDLLHSSKIAVIWLFLKIMQLLMDHWKVRQACQAVEHWNRHGFSILSYDLLDNMHNTMLELKLFVQLQGLVIPWFVMAHIVKNLLKKHNIGLFFADKCDNLLFAFIPVAFITPDIQGNKFKLHDGCIIYKEVYKYVYEARVVAYSSPFSRCNCATIL